MNAKILLRTIKDLNKLLILLREQQFEFHSDEEKLNVAVPISKLKVFEGIITNSLNAPYNYVNVKFPNEKLNVIVFPGQTFMIDNDNLNEIAKKWALSIGLSQPETDWTVCYK